MLNDAYTIGFQKVLASFWELVKIACFFLSFSRNITVFLAADEGYGNLISCLSS